MSFSLSLSRLSTLVHYRMISLSISSTSVHYRTNLCAPYPPSLPSTFNPNIRTNSNQILYPKPKSSLSCNFKQGGQWPFNSSPAREESIDKLHKSLEPDYSCVPKFCSCGRKRFIEGTGTTLFSIPPSNDSHSHPDPSATMNSIRPPRPDWYEEFLASIMDWGMKSYEAEVASYKSQLFTNLRGKAKTVLEIGIGTGPNLKYYAGDNDIVQVFGTDPNRKMEKYAQTAALNAGLPPTNFEFIQAVAEALPLSDASADAVVGTLVLCSVTDVNRTLKEVMRVLKPGGLYLFLEHVAAKDGTILRFLQGVLKPLQQALGDGCHITRTTGKYISEAEGFSDVEMKTASISSLPLISPHVYGIARK